MSAQFWEEKSFIQTRSNKNYTLLWPDEMIMRIFDELRLADIKSCRLVCRRFLSCCERYWITKRKLSFTSDIYSTDEINKLLENIRQSNLKLRLSYFKMDDFRFLKFGGKIESLHLQYCYFGGVEPIIDIFRYTPKMTTIIFDNDYYSSRYRNSVGGNEFWRTVLLVTQKRRLKFNNMVSFACKGNFKTNGPQYNMVPFDIFFQIFPNLKSLDWEGLDLSDFVLRMDSLECNLRALLGAVIQVDSPFEWDVMLMPRLEELEITLYSHTGVYSPIHSCLKLFSHQSKLKSLTLKNFCQSPTCNFADRENFENHLISCILKECVMLRTLRLNSFFNIVPNRSRRISQTIWPQLQPVLRSVDFVITTSNCTISAPCLELSALEEVSDLNVFYLGTYLSTGFDFSTVHSTLSLLLNILNRIRKLEIHILHCPMNTFETDSVTERDSRKIYNKSLEYLIVRIINFKQLSMCYWIRNFHTFFKTCEFQNLLELHLISTIDKTFKHPDKDDILKWIVEIPSLEKIVQNWFCLEMKDVKRIVKKLSRLRELAFTVQKELRKNEIREIFRNSSSSLFLIGVVSIQECSAIFYRVCRSKNMIYYRENSSLACFTLFSYLPESSHKS